MASTRLILGLSAALALAATTASAQSPAAKANTLNDQGKALMSAKKYADAELKFRAAIVLSPEGRFYLNLCMSLYQTGKLGEAYRACRAVEGAGASKDQVGQAATIIDKFIVPRAREAGIDPATLEKPDTGTDTGNTGTDTGNTGTDTGNTGTDTGNTGTDTGNTGNTGNTGTDTGNTGTDTGNTGTNTGNTGSNFTVAPPPSLFDQVAANPKHEYTWSIGAQLLGMKASVGEMDEWDDGAGGVRILGDYALSARRGLGAQGYLTFFNLGSKLDNAPSLTIVDLGVAVYKEVCRGRACVKPLAGLQVALFAIDDDAGSQFSALGGRAELGFEYALGKRYENVLTAAVGLNLYGPAQANEETFADPDSVGLGKSSANLYLGLGFTRRFNSPLGSQPLFTVQ